MTVTAATQTYGAYRPPQWTGPAMVSITVIPQTQASTTSTDAAGNVSTTINGTATTTYVFDAVLGLDHDQRLEKTHHPVQTGADISSHAYLMPARLTLEVGMSDVMDSYAHSAVNSVATGSSIITPWIGSASKSVSAYQTILGLQQARQPLTVTTRLRTYTNMVILSVSPREDYRTITGLRMRVEFEQIFTASTTTAPVSARSNDTGTTGLGTVSPSSVPTATQQQFQQPQAVPSTPHKVVASGPPVSPWSTPASLAGTDYLVDIPGAGAYASVAGQQGLK